MERRRPMSDSDDDDFVENPAVEYEQEVYGRYGYEQKVGLQHMQQMGRLLQYSGPIGGSSVTGGGSSGVGNRQTAQFASWLRPDNHQAQTSGGSGGAGGNSQRSWSNNYASHNSSAASSRTASPNVSAIGEMPRHVADSNTQQQQQRNSIPPRKINSARSTSMRAEKQQVVVGHPVAQAVALVESSTTDDDDLPTAASQFGESSATPQPIRGRRKILSGQQPRREVSSIQSAMAQSPPKVTTTATAAATRSARIGGGIRGGPVKTSISSPATGREGADGGDESWEELREKLRDSEGKYAKRYTSGQSDRKSQQQPQPQNSIVTGSRAVVPRRSSSAGESAATQVQRDDAATPHLSGQQGHQEQEQQPPMPHRVEEGVSPVHFDPSGLLQIEDAPTPSTNAQNQKEEEELSGRAVVSQSSPEYLEQQKTIQLLERLLVEFCHDVDDAKAAHPSLFVA